MIHLLSSSYQLILDTTNRRIDYSTLSKKGDVTMYTLFDEIEKDGVMKGNAEGIIETGLDCGLSEDKILQMLQNRVNLFLQKAQENFEMYGRQTI